MNRPVYFDHNATSPPDPRVVESMQPYSAARHGNPSSLHAYGREARGAVEEARDHVAALLGGAALEVVFTGSGTEANNTVLHTLFAAPQPPAHLVLSSLEHPSIAVPARQLEARGVEVSWVSPEVTGVVSADAVVAALRPSTRLVAVMLANNEIGTLQPVAEISERCRQRGVAVLCDAVQAIGKVKVDVEELGVDYLTLGGHKFHGPLGAAALWTRAGVELEPLLVGGSQERRRRASTENVPAVVGLGRAAELAREELSPRADHLASLRDRFEAGIESLEGASIHCRSSPRLPNTSHVAFAGVEGEALLIRLDLAGFAVSTGSACASGAVEPSPTLLSLGLGPAEALSSLRVSFGMPNRDAEVDRFVERLAVEVAELRRLAPSRAAAVPA